MTNVTAGDVSQGNNNGTTTLLTTTSASSGYTGASGTNNAGAAARAGVLNTAASGSAYFEFTLTPVAGYTVSVSEVKFGSRSTGTGPQAFSILSNKDNYAAAVAGDTLLANSTWALKTTAISPVLTSGVGTSLVIRIYGHSGTGSPSANTANWRIDDLQLSLTATPQGTPTIAAPNPSAPAAFTTTYGTPSATQTFAISGSGLTQAITATAPAGFEVSSDNLTWGTTASFPQTSGSAAGDLRVRLAATAPVSGTYNEVAITLSSQGATNLTLTTLAVGNAVSPKALEIIANDVIKPFGETLNEINPGSTAFTSDGLANSEAIGSVTITYLNGFSSGAAAQVYADAVVPSAATGGTFTPGNYTITYTPGDLSVSSAPLVQVSGTLNAFSTVYGTASAAQSFTVSGSSLTANLIVTAPSGYQVSLNPDSDFVTILQLGPDSGTVPSTTLYLRLRADTPFGAVAAGNVTAASTGATTQNLLVPAGNVSAKELTITGLTGRDKEYDRSTEGSYTGTPVLQGVLPGDVADVTLDSSNAVAFFSQVTVGTDLVLNTNGFALSGSKAGNYSLIQPVLSADITPLEIFLNDPVVTTRAFNGTTAATITGTLGGVVPGDTVNFTGTGTFANVGPGAPIAVTASIVLTGAAAGNYTLVQPTGLSGRINGSATGATIAQWLFNGSSIPGGNASPTPSTGAGTASTVGGASPSSASGVGSSDPAATENNAWNISTFPAQGTGDKTRGVQFNVSTVGVTGVTVQFDIRMSNTAPRHGQIQYTIDGTNWLDLGPVRALVNDGSVWVNDTVLDFTTIPEANDNANFGIRILAAFDPEATGYAAARSTSSFGTSGTWRFDDVVFTGNPPFHFIGSTPAHGATDVAPTSTIQLTFTKPALLTANAVTMLDADNNVIPFAGLPVTEAAAVVTLTPTAPLPYGKAITVTLVRDEITSGGNPLESTTATIPVTFTTEAAVTPVVNVTPSSVEVPINTVATLTANVTAGSAPVTLQWYEGDAGNFGAATLLTGQTGTTLEVTHPTVATRSFFVRATSAANESVNSNTVPVSFTNFVLVTGSTPANAATGVLTDSGITITFSKGVKLQPGGVTISPAVPFTLSPAFNAAEFATSYTLTPDSPLATSTLYTVTVLSALVTDVDAAGMAADFAFSFTTVVPVTITADPQLQNVNVNGTALFNVETSGDGPFTYDWRRNGISIGAPSSPTLTLANVQPSQAGNYSVVVTGPGTGNTATSASAPLTVVVPAIGIAGNGTYNQNFDGMGTTTVASVFPEFWNGFKYAGTGSMVPGTVLTGTSIPALTVGNGGGNAGTIYNLASTATPSDRALGAVASGGFIGAFGASFRNDTTQEIEGDNVKIGFTIEQWRTSSAAAKERIRFEWKIGDTVNATVPGSNPAVIETAGWNPVSTFDLVEVDEGTTNIAVDGNNPTYRVVIPPTAFSTLSGWLPGQILHIRWVDADDTGADAALAIDDFSFEVSDLLPPPVFAFWDANGSVAGAGGPTPTGTWGTDSFWSGDLDGMTATTGWTVAGDAAFSAGSDATGTFTVTLSGLQDAGSLTFQEGSVSLVGDGLLLSRLPASIDVFDGAQATISSVISGANGLRKRGEGTLNLLGTNLFTGVVRLAGGIVSIGADAALGDAENDLLLAGGSLATTVNLTLPATRGLSGSGGLMPAEGTTLIVAGPVDAAGLTLESKGTVELTNMDTLNIGVLTLAAEGTVTGSPVTVQSIVSNLTSGTATVANDLLLGTSNRTIGVDAGATVVLAGDITLGGSAALTKAGLGTLRLTGDNSQLFRVAIGTQGVAPVSGGVIQFDNSTALGTNPVFLNYGTLEALAPLKGANALPVGASMGGRSGAPVVFMGEDMELAGSSGLFAATGLTGDIVIQVDNTTLFSGPFTAATNANIDAVRFTGTGTVVLSGDKSAFRAPIKLDGSVTLVLDTDVLSAASAPNPLITVPQNTKLVIGAESGTRLVTAYNSLNAEAGSVVEFDIGGTARGSGYDAVDFEAGGGVVDITVAGTVKVNFLSGYVPAAGHAFRLLKWGTGANINMVDVSLDLPALSDGLSWDTGNFESNGLIVISGPNMGPVITSPPVGGTVNAGENFVFTVEVLGTGTFTYDWKKDGVSLGAPNLPTLSLSGITTARTGLYTVSVTNAQGTTESDPAELIVIGAPFISVPPQSRAVVDGTVVEFTFTAVGPGTLTQQWQYNNGVDDWQDIVNETGLTLTVTAGPTTHGSYRVVVTSTLGMDTYGPTTSAAATLSPPTAGPANSRPVWAPLADLPPGQIGVVYSFDLDVLPDDPANNIFRSASSFSATGLPSGLRIDSATGEITGTPVAIKATPYAVSVTARNPFGTAVLRTRILINPLPTGGLGVFTGPIQRSAILDGIVTGNNGALGGRFDMTVSATSAVSGKLTLGAKAYSFRGVRATIPTAPANRLSLAATIRVNATVNLVVNLLVDTLTGTILDASTITDGTTTVTFKGWRNPWGTKAPATQATTLAGYYTTKLDLVDGALTSSQAPVGSGYLSFTVAPKTGTLKLSGKLSDGSTITMATFAGPAGQILLFRPLYAAAVRGSVLGELGIAAEPDPLNNTVDGDLSWTRPANAAASNRLYKAGFPVPGELAVKVDGARYVAPTPRNSRNPTAEPRVMGLTDAANEIEVLLTGAGVETALPLQTNVKANVALNNKVTFNLDPLVNTRKMTLTFNAAKGTFTGRVTLKQNNPLLEMSVPPLLVPVTRTVTYQGLIVKGAGAGYFILAQLPAMAGDTPTKTAQEGGKAEIKAVPVIP